MLIVELVIAVLLATGLVYAYVSTAPSGVACNCLGSFDTCTKVIAECRASQQRWDIYLSWSRGLIGALVVVVTLDILFAVLGLDKASEVVRYMLIILLVSTVVLAALMYLGPKNLSLP